MPIAPAADWLMRHGNKDSQSSMFLLTWLTDWLERVDASLVTRGYCRAEWYVAQVLTLLITCSWPHRSRQPPTQVAIYGSPSAYGRLIVEKRAVNGCCCCCWIFYNVLVSSESVMSSRPGLEDKFDGLRLSWDLYSWPWPRRSRPLPWELHWQFFSIILKLVQDNKLIPVIIIN